MTVLSLLTCWGHIFLVMDSSVQLSTLSREKQLGLFEFHTHKVTKTVAAGKDRSRSKNASRSGADEEKDKS
jgi:hypothetical protein